MAASFVAVEHRPLPALHLVCLALRAALLIVVSAVALLCGLIAVAFACWGVIALLAATAGGDPRFWWQAAVSFSYVAASLICDGLVVWCYLDARNALRRF